MVPVSPGVSGMQPRDPCRPWRGTLASGHKPAAGGSGDVAGAIQGTWDTAKTQIKAVVNNVVFSVIDMILAVCFFAKLAMTYMDYRKHGQFEWAGPAILFASLVFSLTAPLYIWGIIGM